MKETNGSFNDLEHIKARKEMVGFPDRSARNFAKKQQQPINDERINRSKEDKPTVENRDDDDDEDIMDKVFERLHNAMLIFGETVCTAASSPPDQKDIDLITQRLSECGKIAGGKDYETMSAIGSKSQSWDDNLSSGMLQQLREEEEEESKSVFIAPVMDNDIENASITALAEEEENNMAAPPTTPIFSEPQQMEQEKEEYTGKEKQPTIIVIVDAEEEAERLNLTNKRKMMISDYLSDDLREEAERILATPKKEWTNEDSIFVNDFLLHELRDDYRAIAWKIDSFSEYAQRNDSTASIDGSRQSFASSLSDSTTSFPCNRDDTNQESYDPFVSYQQLRNGMGRVLDGSQEEERGLFTSPTAHIESLLRSEIEKERTGQGEITAKKRHRSLPVDADEEIKILGVSSFLDDF